MPQERSLETSNEDEERGREVMTGKHPEPRKDTKEEQKVKD